MTDDLDLTTAASERLALMLRSVATAIRYLRDERAGDALDRLADAVVEDGLLVEAAAELASAEVKEAAARLQADLAGVRLDPGWLARDRDGEWIAQSFDTTVPRRFGPVIFGRGRTAVEAIEELGRGVRSNRDYIAGLDPSQRELVSGDPGDTLPRFSLHGTPDEADRDRTDSP
jgi:hypothetical protein